MAELRPTEAGTSSRGERNSTTTITSSNSTDTDASCSDTSAKSLLDVLKCPQRSEFARKRSVALNLPHDGRRHKAPKRTHDPKGVTPGQRVREFPTECLSVSANKLFCTACREELALKLSIIRGHIASSKHTTGKDRLHSRKAQERDIAMSLETYNSEVHARGETLPESHRVYRVKALMTFLRAGVPLNKIEHFRPLLEEHAYSLGGRRAISDLIPFVLQSERTKLKEEITGREVSVIFDGTTHLGEAMAVVLRFVNTEWQIEQRLVRLMLLSKSMTGEEIARELIVVLSTGLGIGPEMLIAAMRDRAAVNGAAMRTVKVLYPNVLDVGCFSHTIDNAGRHFSTPILDEFMRCWLALFSHSPKARLLWKARTGRSMRSHSSTRWWSKWEVMEQLLVSFGDVKAFLDDNQDIGLSTRTKLLDILNDAARIGLLQIELAAVIDAGAPLVKATYNLEGDGALVWQCHDQISTVLNAITTSHHPNVTAIVARVTGGNRVAYQQGIAYAGKCVKGAQDYFRQKMNGELKDQVLAFKAAKFFWPQRAVDLGLTSTDLDSLLAFPFFSTAVTDGLKEELPQYLTLAADASHEIDPLEWWKCHETDLPKWSRAARQVVLVQPSSAAAERVFSILKSSFGDQQTQALEDYIEASVQLQYNHR